MAECPKCGEPLRGQIYRGLLEVDVAHSGETWELAHEKIVRAVDRGILHGHRGVKIIHGYGSAGAGRAVIASRAIPLLRSLSERTGGRMVQEKGNPGAHILWFGPKRPNPERR